MSFFFDVWMREGFVLASDVRLMVNDKPSYKRKLYQAPASSKVKCAMAVCGDSLERSIHSFKEATALGDTFREVTREFASRWTERYAGTRDYSAVHIVGFERIPGSAKAVPQMWYWRNWADGAFISEDELNRELATFSDPVPANNHIPTKLVGINPPTNLQEEYNLVNDYLAQSQPIFTWNGDNSFWRSATDVVGSAMELLLPHRSILTLDQAVEVTNICLEFLVKLGALLPQSSVGASPLGKFDILVVTPTSIEWRSRPKLPESN